MDLNLTSITDGRVYLSPSLFDLGVLPAVDVAKSVSRVGGKAQLSSRRVVAANLKLAYAQFEELERFARFGVRMDENTQKLVDHGRRIRECLKQSESAPVAVPEQIALLLALSVGLFDAIPLARMPDAQRAFHEAASLLPAELCARFASAHQVSDEDRKTVTDMARDGLAPFQPKPSIDAVAAAGHRE